MNKKLVLKYFLQQKRQEIWEWLQIAGGVCYIMGVCVLVTVGIMIAMIACSIPCAFLMYKYLVPLISSMTVIQELAAMYISVSICIVVVATWIAIPFKRWIQRNLEDAQDRVADEEQKELEALAALAAMRE